MEQQCIFCGIATGQVPSKTIFEDDVVRVVLDIYPANPAHMLVLPKQHHAILNQLSKEEVEHLGKIAKQLSELIFKVLKPDGINFFIANGAVAGQKAPHFILHAIPRFKGDGLNFEAPEKEIDKKELSAFYDKLKPILKNYFPGVDFTEKEMPEEEKKADKNESKKEDKEDINLDEITEMFS